MFGRGYDEKCRRSGAPVNNAKPARQPLGDVCAAIESEYGHPSSALER